MIRGCEYFEGKHLYRADPRANQCDAASGLRQARSYPLAVQLLKLWQAEEEEVNRYRCLPGVSKFAVAMRWELSAR